MSCPFSTSEVKHLTMNEEKIALSLALEVMECEREKYRYWAYSELNENDNWERMTYEDAINTIRKMIEQLKEEKQ